MNFATFNTYHGLQRIVHKDDSLSLDLETLMKDVNKHEIDALAIQETHFPEFEYEQKEKDYKVFCVNEVGNIHHGAGIVIKSKYNPTFKRISTRVCTATFKLDD